MFLDRSMEECFFCGREGRLGDGLVLKGRFICGCCERRLVHTGCDSRFYLYYVKRLKNIWRCAGA